MKLSREAALQKLIERGVLNKGATLEDARQKLNSFTSQNQEDIPIEEPVFSRTPAAEMGDEILGGIKGAYNLVNRGAGDILSGLTAAGQGIRNAPYELINSLSPALAQKLPFILQPDTTDYAKEAFGIEDPNLADSLIKGAAQFAPYALGGEAVLATKGEQALANLGIKPLLKNLMKKQAKIGSVYGLTQEENPAAGALGGALAGGAFPVAGKAIGAGLEKIAQYGRRLTAPSIVKNIEEALLGKNNKQAFDIASKNHEIVSDVENKAWSQVNQLAQEADISKLKFNNRPYQKALETKLNELEKQSAKQKGFALKNKEAEQFLQEQLLSSQTNFKNALEHNKALNVYLKKTMGPEMKAPSDIIQFAKKELAKTIQSNLEKHGLEKNLGKAWEEANQVTSLKNRIFEQLPASKSAKPNRSTFGNIINNENSGVDVTSFVKDYLPKAGEKDIARMAQFAKMMGNKEEAAKVLGKNYFSSAFEGNEINPKSFLNKFNDLSEAQKKFIFSKDKLNTISAFEKAYKKDPRLLKEPGFISHFTRSVLEEIGLLDKFSTPQAQQKFIQSMLSPQELKLSPKIQTAAKGARTVITPATTSLASALANYLGDYNQ